MLDSLWSFLGRRKVPEATLDVFAMLPVVSLIESREPFDTWCPHDIDVPEALREAFKGSVHLYQMYVFWIRTARRFGYDIAEKMSSIQTDRLSRASLELAEELDAAIHAIHSIVARETENERAVEVEGKRVEIPLEYKMALWFLTVPEGSPYHVSSEAYGRGEMPDFAGNDFLLAQCLAHGKTAALRVFQPIVKATKVTL